MADLITPQLAQAAERWLADKVLIDLLRTKELAALHQLGNSLEVNTMLRAQGVYKAVNELIKFIEAAASKAEPLRHSAVLPRFPIN